MPGCAWEVEIGESGAGGEAGEMGLGDEARESGERLADKGGGPAPERRPRS